MMAYFDPKQQQGQFTVFAIGLMTFVCVGMAACIGLVVVAFYLVVQLVLLLLQLIVETFSSIAALWAASDPFTKVLILAILGLAAYRLYQWRMKKGGKP
jgi:hypothetical protein